MTVKNIETLNAMVAKVKTAQQEFATFNQQQVDKIFRAAALAASTARIPLAQMAVEESGMGVLEDKVTKNHFASEYIYNKYKDSLTCALLKKITNLAPLPLPSRLVSSAVSYQQQIQLQRLFLKR